MLLKLSSLLATLSLSIGTKLEEATRAFEIGELPRVLELAKAGCPDELEGARLNYLAGEVELLLGAPAEAEALFRAVLAKRPKALPAQVGLGRALTAQAKFDEAGKALEAALGSDAKDVGALSAHGLLLSITGQSEKACQELRQAFELDPKGALTVRAYVEALLRADENPSAAEVIEAFIAARPKHPMGPFLLAWTLERDGEDAQAIERYQEALTNDPNFIDAHKNLAILCHTLSKTYQDKARTLLAFEHYERYFALGGKDQELRTMYADLLKFKGQILGQ
jgi:tetratricopeptide (TPR) repeat protein